MGGTRFKRRLFPIVFQYLPANSVVFTGDGLRDRCPPAIKQRGVYALPICEFQKPVK
jgi:hypothetical protein